MTYDLFLACNTRACQQILHSMLSHVRIQEQKYNFNNNASKIDQMLTTKYCYVINWVRFHVEVLDL